MDEIQQRMERQCDNKAAQHGHKRNGKHTALVILALKSVADDRLSDGQRHHRIQNTGGLDDQVGDTHFILRHHAGVETQHEDNENLGTERAYREDKGIAEKAFVLIHFLPFLSRSVGNAVGQPCSDDAAQHADDRTGQYVGRVMDAGIQP